jgi:hypothetical protein
MHYTDNGSQISFYTSVLNRLSNANFDAKFKKTPFTYLYRVIINDCLIAVGVGDVVEYGPISLIT